MLLRSIVSRKSKSVIAILTSGLFGWWIARRYLQPAQRLTIYWPGKGSGDGAVANETLGFGAIVAISAEDQNDPHAWRQKGLIAAANRTGLQVEIALPPPINATEFNILMSAGTGPFPRPGSGKALYAHLALLEWFLARNIETMLVMEDDADWEVDIRKLLAPSGAIAAAIRRSTESSVEVATYPYGNEWDLLWLGHCGFESLQPQRKIAFADLDTIPTERFKAVVRPQNYHNMADHTREVHPRVAAMCTFGVGITRHWAKTVLSHRHKGGTKGYDFTSNVHCKGGLRCVGVLPEVIHQQKALGGGIMGTIEKLNNIAKPPDASDPTRYWTLNLKYSARCNAKLRDPIRATCYPAQKDWESYNS